MFNPCATTRALGLKQQLVRATIAGMDAIRQVDARARFIAPDPLINVGAALAENARDAERYRLVRISVNVTADFGNVTDSARLGVARFRL
jgi:hypothetical protein